MSRHILTRDFVISGLLAALTVIAIPVHLPAEPILFTQTGTGTGVIGTTSFQDASFSIRALGDTANVIQVGAGIWSVDHNSASIAISGLGTYQFTTATRTFVNQNFDQDGQIGFSRGGAGGYDLYSNLNSPAFRHWSISSSIGPITGHAELHQWKGSYPPVMTTGGRLMFDTHETDCTFQATVGLVPEPSTFALLTLCAMILLAYAWRCWRR